MDAQSQFATQIQLTNLLFFSKTHTLRRGLLADRHLSLAAVPSIELSAAPWLHTRSIVRQLDMSVFPSTQEASSSIGCGYLACTAPGC